MAVTHGYSYMVIVAASWLQSSPLELPMQFSPQCRHIALAVATLCGFTSLAHADSTVHPRQDRAGLMLNIPFDSRGLVFKESVLSLIYQSARVKSSASGWQLAFGSKLNNFSPVFAVSALGGDRCGYATIGVSYGDGKWGLPIGLYGPHVQVGLSNIGGFGGFQVGLSSLGCFKRYTPPTTTTAPVTSGSVSGSGSGSGSSSSQVFEAPPMTFPPITFPPTTTLNSASELVGNWLRNTDQSNDFDWA